MMTKNAAKLWRTACRLVLPIVLAGLLCSSCAFEPGEGGIGGTGIIAIGPIQKFGSIFVNGRELFLNNETLISSDGKLLTEADLHLGDMVTAEAHSQNGRIMITGLSVDQALQGRIERIDPHHATLTLLGQTIHYDADTRGEENNVLNTSQLRQGDNIAVSGLQRDANTWIATRITRSMHSNIYRLRSTVRTIDHQTNQLVIGNMRLQFATPSALKDISINSPMTIEGSYRTDGKLTVSHTQIDKPRLYPLGTRIELSGYIQTTPTQGEFTTQGLTVRYDRASNLQTGEDRNLRTGSFVMLRGHIVSGGIVAAETMVLNAVPLRGNLPSHGNDDSTDSPGNGRNNPNTGPDHTKPSPPGLIHRPIIIHPERPVR